MKIVKNFSNPMLGIIYFRYFFKLVFDLCCILCITSFPELVAIGVSQYSKTDKMVIVKWHTVKCTDCCKVLRERNIISRKHKIFFSLQVPEYILNFILY